MQTATEKKDELIKFLLSKGRVSNNVKDYSNEPFFIKKTEAAKKRLERVTIPEALLTKK